MADSLALDTGDAVFRSLDRYLREAGLEEVARRELELPIEEWGGRVRSFLASDLRAVSTRICEVLQSRGAIPAEEAADLIRGSTLEFEEHHTTWPWPSPAAASPSEDGDDRTPAEPPPRRRADPPIPGGGHRHRNRPPDGHDRRDRLRLRARARPGVPGSRSPPRP
jgi:hypothetical protein